MLRLSNRGYHILGAFVSVNKVSFDSSITTIGSAQADEACFSYPKSSAMVLKLRTTVLIPWSAWFLVVSERIAHVERLECNTFQTSFVRLITTSSWPGRHVDLTFCLNEPVRRRKRFVGFASRCQVHDTQSTVLWYVKDWQNWVLLQLLRLQLSNIVYYFQKFRR